MTHAVRQPVSTAEREELNDAIALIQSVFGADVQCLVLRDERGLFLHFRPGHELELVREIGRVNWRHVERLVEEHSS